MRELGSIRIFYVHYNTGRYEKKSRDPSKQRPAGFTYQNCFDNLLLSIRQSAHKSRVHLTIWFDGNEDDFNHDFISKALPSDISHQIIIAEFRNGTRSCWTLVDYISNSKFKPNDLIYCLENDYNHRLHWLDSVVEIATSSIEFDYLSLYDHNDNYTLPIHRNHHIQLSYTESQIWKTGLSTCWSFLSWFSVFSEDRNLLRSNEDFVLFVKLCTIGRRLLISVPGLSTHCMVGYESPAIDWQAVRSKVSQTCTTIASSVKEQSD